MICLGISSIIKPCVESIANPLMCDWAHGGRLASVQNLLKMPDGVVAIRCGIVPHVTMTPTSSLIVTLSMYITRLPFRFQEAFPISTVSVLAFFAIE